MGVLYEDASLVIRIAIALDINACIYTKSLFRFISMPLHKHTSNSKIKLLVDCIMLSKGYALFLYIDFSIELSKFYILW